MDSLLYLFAVGIIFVNQSSALPTELSKRNFNTIPKELLEDLKCLRLTEETEKDLDGIASEFSDFLYHLSLQYEHLHISSVKLQIEAHTGDQINTELKFVVKNCENAHKRIIEDNNVKNTDLFDDTYNSSVNDGKSHKDSSSNPTSKAKSNLDQHFSSNDRPNLHNGENITKIDMKLKNNVNSKSGNVVFGNNDDGNRNNVNYHKLTVNNDENDSEFVKDTGSAIFLDLNLDDDGEKLFEAVEKRNDETPVLLYVQKFMNTKEIMFLNK